MNAEKPTQDRATVWVILPFALAILGTIIMLFTNSANILKVSLVLALWAAAAGMLLVTRLRSDKTLAERELEARSQSYQAELDAIHARGEADRAALALARNDENIPVGIEVEVLREIQAELAQLRAQLEQLSGHQFENERAALRAEARRIAELGTGSTYAGTSAKPVVDDTVSAELEPISGSTRVQQEPSETTSPVTPTVSATGSTTGSTLKTPAADSPSAVRVPSTEDTAVIKRVEDEEPQPAAPQPAAPESDAQEKTSTPRSNRPTGAPSSEAVAGRLGSPGTDTSERASRQRNQNNPLSQLISERQAEQHAQPKPDLVPDKPAEPTKPAKPTKPAEPVKPWAEPQAHGRRRRDERGRSSLSVAELLARSQNAEQKGRE